ncbi:MAG: dihydrofolate reductase family protein [Zetaproteobacteria bacterium]|nr:dihydrofolate reductase family protein [Zetaproteobacteria bacterium]
MDELLCLYPKEEASKPIEGLYLSYQLHRQALEHDVCIYSNYITSLDGRIAVYEGNTNEFSVPACIANTRDWRLYQELAAQADIMLTSARYFRQLAKGCAQDLLPVGMGEDYEDLRHWREKEGLAPQPDVMIVSASLDIPLDILASLSDRKVWVVTTSRANTTQKKALQAIGVGILIAGENSVEGVKLKQHLIEKGYRSAYMIAGPQVHQTLLMAGVLNRMFLTTHLSLLGHDAFHTILQGNMSPVSCELSSLYLDVKGQQMFGQYRISHTQNI